MRTARKLTVALAVLPCLAACYHAAAQEEDENDIFELSPFTVDASEDQGYRAANTLAGTRLNASLRHTPATLSVFTEEFLEDAGIENTNEALEYSVTFDVDSTSNNGNNYQSNDLIIRARGFSESNFASRDFFRWFVKSDSYNTTRFTFAHGPNSILFGNGNPGGIVNTITERAVFREFNELELKIDEYGTYRAQADFNREIVDDVLALRVNLLKEDERTYRDNEYEDQFRYHIAGTWKPVERTTFRVDFEDGAVDRLRQRRWTVRDRFTAWRDAGSNPVDYRDFRDGEGNIDFDALEDFADSVEATFQDDPFPVIIDDGATRLPTNLQYSVRSNGSNDHLKEFDVFPKDTGLVPVNTTDYEFSTATFSIEQKFFDNLYLDLAYNTQEDERTRLQMLNHNDISAYVDVAPTLLDGSANPNFGEYFMLARRIFYVPTEREGDTFRATASYSLESDRKWLGRHQLAVLYQDEKVESHLERWEYTNTTPLNPNRNRIRQNRVGGLTYITGPNAADGYRFNPFEDPIAPYDLTDPLTGEVIGRVTPEFLQDRERPERETTESYMVAGQSFFLDDKLALTWGYREDTLEQASFIETTADSDYVDANPGTLRDQILSSQLGPSESFTGDTTTYGVVYTPLEWFSLAANFSENFQPQTALNMFNENIGNISGQGEDYSLRFAFLEGKVYATFTYFTTEATNVADNAFTEFTWINEIWETLQANEIVSNPTFVVEGVTTSESFKAEGFEFEITANPTKNITFRANLADGTNEISAINPFHNAYLEEHVPTWEPHRDVLLLNGEDTVGERIDDLVDRNNRQRLAIGEGSEGHVKLRGNFFGKYTFHEGALEGFDVGLGARHRSGRTTGFYNGPNGETLEAEGNSYWIFDLKFGYRTQIMADKVDLKLQLNIKNLFDEDDIILTEADNQGMPDDYVLQSPRAISLTAKFVF